MKKQGKKGRLIAFLIFMFLLAVNMMTAIDEDQPNNLKIILDAKKYNRITPQKLVKILGEPSLKDTWTNKTSFGNHRLTTYCYTKKKKDLEFSIYKGRVARVKIFAKKEVGVYPAIIMTS